MSATAHDASRSIYAFRRNLVLAASAGTGKTHALVGVAVHLLVGGCQNLDGSLRAPIAPGALVATTFSRKAAREIRVRLTEELDHLASGDLRSLYRADLVAACVEAEGAPWSDEELSGRARVALRGLGRAKIGTLHSFATSIARANALALGLSPDFDLPDEETARERTASAIERVLEARAGEDELIALIALAGGVEPFVDLVQRTLTSVADDGRGAAEVRIAEDDATLVDADVRALVQHARDLVAEAKLGEPARALVAAYDQGDAEALERATEALCTVAKTTKKTPAAEAFFAFREELFEASSGTTNPERGANVIRRWRVRDRMLPCARTFRSILVQCETEIAEDNVRDSVLSFADVLRAARDVLRDNPRVAAETSATLEALLVDEFQDTSGVQRDLVQLLWERDRREDGRDAMRAAGTIPSPGDLRGSGLLVVGDRKQSIYGFRGADVAVFAELSVGLAGAPARDALAIPAGLVWEPAHPSADFIPLRHNRRGEPELLDFANACSRLSLVPTGDTAALYEVSYVPATEDLVPPVPPVPSSRVTARTHWLRVAPTGKAKSSSRLDEARVMAARIGCIVRGGELTVRGAPARWRDIAILAQRHTMLDAAAYTLAAAGIPHVVAGMGFYRAREVRDVMAMLAFLVDPEDSLARIEVLRGPWAAVTDRTLVALTDKHAGVADVAQWGVGERRALIEPCDREALSTLGTVVTRLRGVVGRIGPGAALREAVRALSLEETLILLPRGEQLVANVRKLLAMGDVATNAAAFLQRVRHAAAAQEREGEAAVFSDEDDAVRLLTVHASKGLAFPIVFLPEAGSVPSHGAAGPVILESGVAGSPTALAMRIQDDLGVVHDTPSYRRVKQERARRDAAEARRKRYVAVTRASEAMFFVGDRAVPKVMSNTYRSATASILAELADTEATRLAAALDVERGESLLREPAARPSLVDDAPARTRSLPLLVVASRHPLHVRAESLREAAHCTRRFQLVHADDAAPDTSSPWQSRGVVSLVKALSGAGDWGARLACDQPHLVRNDSSAFMVEATDALSIVVEASVDLTVLWPDGSADVVCFVEPRTDVDSDALYASVLAHGARARDSSIAAARVGFLRPTEPATAEPTWLLPRDLEWTRAHVREIVGRIAAATRHDLAPRVPVATCRATDCPFLAGCHPTCATPVVTT